MKRKKMMILIIASTFIGGTTMNTPMNLVSTVKAELLRESWGGSPVAKFDNLLPVSKTAFPSSDTVVDTSEPSFKMPVGEVTLKDGQGAIDKGTIGKMMYYGTVEGSLFEKGYVRNVGKIGVGEITVDGDGKRYIGVTATANEPNGATIKFGVNDISKLTKEVTAKVSIKVMINASSQNGNYVETNTPMTCKLIYNIKVLPNPETPKPDESKEEYGDWILSYDANGGQFPNGQSTMEVKSSRKNDAYGKKVDITNEIPTKDGYDFAFWMDKDARISIYASAINVNEVTQKYIGKMGESTFSRVNSSEQFLSTSNTNISESIYLKAVWNQIYKVAFDLDGGSDGPENLKGNFGIKAPSKNTYTNNEAVVITLPQDVPIKEGYIFNGWQGDRVYKAGENIEINSKKPNITLKATWKENLNIYTLSYDLDGGTFSDDIATKETVKNASNSYKFTLNTIPTKLGYKFDKWVEVKTIGSRNFVSDIYGNEVEATKNDPNVVVKAIWKANTNAAGSQTEEPEKTSTGSQTEGPETESTGSQTEGSGTASTGSQTEGSGTASTGSQTEESEKTSTGSQTEGSGTASTGSQTEGPGTASTGSQTEGSGTASTGSQTEGSETESTGSQTEGSGTASTGSQAEGSGTESTGSQTEGSGTASTGSQTEGSETESIGSQTEGSGTASTGSQAEGKETASTGSQAEGKETESTGSQTEGKETVSIGTQTNTTIGKIERPKENKTQKIISNNNTVLKDKKDAAKTADSNNILFNFLLGTGSASLILGLFLNKLKNK